MIFNPAPHPANEYSRRKALLRSGLVQQRGSKRLTALSHATKKLFRADWSAVVTALDGWQHVVASSGGHLGMHRRSSCLSSYALASAHVVFYVLDARADHNLKNSMFVQNQLIAFYAGAPICDAAGFVIGVLCITNRSSRPAFTPAEQDRLMAQARIAAEMIEQPRLGDLSLDVA